VAMALFTTSADEVDSDAPIYVILFIYFQDVGVF
jgi:hypothetical protein